MNRLQVVAAEAAHREDHAVGGHGRGNRVHRRPGRLPDHLAGFEIVAPQAVHAVGHDLCAAVVLDDERRRPRVDLLALHPPDLRAGALVERDDERGALVIPDDDQVVAVECGRGTFAELVAHLLVAEVFLPDERPVHVVGVEAERLEEGEDMLAVGRRGARRPRTVVGMARLVRLRLARRALPGDLAGAAIDRVHDEAMCLSRRDAAARRVRRSAGCGRGNRGQHEEPVAPDDGRRGSAPGNLDLPANIL